MTAATPTSTPADEAAYYKAILHELVDMAADIARTVHQQARRQAARAAEAQTAALPPPPAANDREPDLTVAFDRIARTIRRTIALAQSLDLPPKPAAARATPDRIAARKRILRRVENEIHREAKPGEQAALRAELRERLDSPDLADDLETRPIEQIIADICRDLQIAFPSSDHWKRRTPSDIEALRRQAAAIPETWPETTAQVVRMQSAAQTPKPRYHTRA